MACKQETLIQRYELVEVAVPANAPVGQINLPPSIANLQNNPTRSVYIKDIEIFPDYAQAFSIRNGATPGLPVADVPKISLSVYYDDKLNIRYIPISKLIYTQPPTGVACPFQQERVAFDMLYPVMIDQCFLQFNSTGGGTAYVVPIGFTYIAVPVIDNKPLA